MSHASDLLKEWFLQQRRELPWRENPTPYTVWISEVMLQQTQVAVVIPYFHRWMKKFPTLESLASASLDDVVKLWEGLGYYSRARNLHKAAQWILEKHGGEIPSKATELEALPGFGPYTVGAVLSFAHHQKAAAVDGNVIRVLSRYFASTAPCTKLSHFQELTISLLPDDKPWVTMEALIELGAQICQKKPKCLLCPLIENCTAYRTGHVLDFPTLKKRPTTIYLKRRVALILCDSSLLIRKETAKKLMGGLYEFPYTSWEEEFPFQFPLEKIYSFPVVKQGFTRYDVSLFPTLYKTLSKEIYKDYEWCEMKRLSELPFSSGHRRLVELLHAYFAH